MSLYFLPSKTPFEKCVLLETTNSVIVFFLESHLAELLIGCMILLVPPFGQEDLQDLQSIFEVAHLQKYVQFLDTQCEISFPFGEFGVT